MHTTHAPTPTPTPVITDTHLRDTLNLPGALILATCPTTGAARVAVVGRRTRPGERLLATPDAVHDFYRRVGSIPAAATALTAALAAVTTGRLL